MVDYAFGGGPLKPGRTLPFARRLYPKAEGMTTRLGGVTGSVFPGRANAGFQAVARALGMGLLGRPGVVVELVCEID
jgi:hypothetical protein